MTIERAYPAGWGVGDKLLSSQLNTIDANTTYTIDKRNGQRDIFASVVVATGPGRLIKTVQTGPDAAATFHVHDGTSIVRVPTLTAARTYTLGHTGATGGDRMLFYVEGTGSSPSGYAEIVNNQGTGIFRLGPARGMNFNATAQGDAAEFIFAGGTWVLLHGEGPGMRSLEFTSSTTWVCPPGVYEVLFIGYGGGGGGGTGGQPLNGTGVHRTSGGGGGGGSQLRVLRVRVVPGREYTITIGAGGASDADGGDTIVTDNSFAIPTNIAVFAGASRGFKGGVATCTSGLSSTGGVTGHAGCLALGGPGTRMYYNDVIPTGGLPYSQPTATRIEFGSDTCPFRGPAGPGAGGPGVTANFPRVFMRHGWYSAEGFAGGTAGQHGVDVSNANNGVGGGGGGGGGGGPGGIGGAGGTGGAAISGETGKTAQIGGAAAANTGAGGGGGGGPGDEVDFGAGSPSFGGAGGSGKLTATFFK